MEPVYHLEGIVKSRDSAQDFEGPLNLILMLLSKNKVEIRDIQVSLILDQYLEHVEKMQGGDLELASEFVQMASQLLYIKTRMLLTGDEEITELEQLMSSLEQLKCRDAYAAVRAVTPELLRRAERGVLLYSTPGEPAPKYGPYDYRHRDVELLEALCAMLGRGARTQSGASDAAGIVPRRIAYGVRQKSRELIELLRGSGSLPLAALYARSRSRSEVIATFLAVLELCVVGSLRVSESADGLLVSFTGGDMEEILESIGSNIGEQDTIDAG